MDLSPERRQQVLKQLLADLTNKDPLLREHAADTLVKMGWKPTTQQEQIIYFIASKKWNRLVKIGVPTVHQLIVTLNDNDYFVLSHIIDTLGEIKDTRAVKPLIAILSGKKIFAKNYITKLKEKIEELLISGRSKVTEDITSHNSEIEKTCLESVRPFLSTLKDDVTRVRISTIKALGKIGGKMVVKPLLLALKDDDPDVQKCVSKALLNIGEDAVEPIADALNEVNIAIRRSGIEILGKINSETAISPLITVLTDEEKSIRMSAVKALSKIGGDRSIEPLISALKDTSSSVRELAADALGIIGDKRAANPLISALKDEDFSVRENAAKALGRIGDKRATKPLITALKDKNPFVRSSAAKALGRIGDKRATKPLIAALNDKDKWVRGSVAFVLKGIDDELIVDPLIAALKDESKDVRWAVISALAEIKDSKAIKSLMEILKGEDAAEIGKYVAKALKETRGPHFLLPESKAKSKSQLNERIYFDKKAWGKLQGRLKKTDTALS